MSVVIIILWTGLLGLRTDNDSTAFTLFLYLVGFMILINPQLQSPVHPEYKKRECLLNQHQ